MPHVNRRRLLETASSVSFAAIAFSLTALDSKPVQAATEYPDADLTLSISTPAQLTTQVNKWNNGDYASSGCVHLVLGSTGGGTPYGAITIDSYGGDNNRLVIRSAVLLGAKFSGKVTVVAPKSTVWGLTLDGSLVIGGNGSRALRNKVRNGGERQAILIRQSTNARVAFNDVGSGRAGISINIPDTVVTTPRIDHNLIEDMWEDPGSDNNLHEPIQLGESKNTTNISLGAVCEYNLIRNVPKIADDNEGISVKSSDNRVRYNNLIDCGRYITNRNGRNNIYRGNRIDGSLGLAIRDKDNSAISNLIQNTTASGDGLRVLCGDVNPNNYPASGDKPAAANTLLAANRVDEAVVGAQEGAGTVNATGTQVEKHMNVGGTVFTNWNNPIIRQGTYQTSTSFSATSAETYTAPPVLTLSDVGPSGTWVA